MGTKYGLRGTIVPGERFKTADESFVDNGFEIEIKDGVIAVGFSHATDAEHARAIVQQYLAWFSLECGAHYSADLNQSWEVKPDNTRAIAISVFDTVNVVADIRVTKATQQGRALIASKTFDSAQVANCMPLVAKSKKSPTVAKALAYFSEEVVDSKRPLYGVYKALEELSHALGGRSKLAALVNRPEKYVGDVMETTQRTRHARTTARQLLTDDECRARARILLVAFANAI